MESSLSLNVGKEGYGTMELINKMVGLHLKREDNYTNNYQNFPIITLHAINCLCRRLPLINNKSIMHLHSQISKSKISN